ncbi:Alginate biosynthesis transcriptional regulatory protein AlgB [Pseudoalteromonas sp. CIP111854]|uniref:Alginate biosynthesis transcriptional regulatory protein AlgB n=1 Tax=Pseudoalteromonas holothuriae TaxID=2963714 RepID=A0A9W4W238_9GAMM|nr:sigma-54 dependent transcriptional regulator [Pseudoalteromonas sp. CIP111854]CAH9063835.1 Alginate biosynthesis transcriptional regulatory protein AlgB [Pseudoalteromonas sp. CIP111854]
MSNPILIIDDDEGIRHALSLLLMEEGYPSLQANSPIIAKQLLKSHTFSMVITDLNFTQDTTSAEEGLALIQQLRLDDEQLPILAITGWGSIEIAVKAMQHGANDFVQKPWENERLITIVRTQLQLAKANKRSQKLAVHNQLLQNELGFISGLIAHSVQIKQVLATLSQVAKSDVSVLLTGENGTGKSLFARYLHDLSTRKEEQLISVNMGAVSESLFESEMFGHVKGAFTDAKSQRIGRFELADEGTLFLDEIANTPYSQQAKLLRVLEEKQFEKVGASKTQSVDIRLVAATNADLTHAVATGEFRKDLLYRINTVQIHIPPLRERIADILPLAHYFLGRVIEKYAAQGRTLTAQAQRALQDYHWPGNVRELAHIMERAHILAPTEHIDAEHLNLTPVQQPKHVEIHPYCTVDTAHLTLNEIEQDALVRRLAFYDGDAVAAAQSLGLSRSTFYRRLNKAGK